MAAENVNIIALRVVRHSDSQSILTAYSREHGRLSLALPAGKGRSAARSKALTLPLSLLQCVADFRPGREILPMRSVMPTAPLGSLRSNPIKQMLVMFIAEVLVSVLRDNQGEPALYDFIAGAVKALDSVENPRAIANFHIWFLSRLAAMLGIEPDASTFAPGSVLDMRDGLWRRTPPLHGDYLDPQASQLAWQLTRMNLLNLSRYPFTRPQRNEIIDRILDYYSTHLTNLRNLHSPAILRSML